MDTETLQWVAIALGPVLSASAAIVITIKLERRTARRRYEAVMHDAILHFDKFMADASRDFR